MPNGPKKGGQTKCTKTLPRRLSTGGEASFISETQCRQDKKYKHPVIRISHMVSTRRMTSVWRHTPCCLLHTCGSAHFRVRPQCIIEIQDNSIISIDPCSSPKSLSIVLANPYANKWLVIELLRWTASVCACALGLKSFRVQCACLAIRLSYRIPQAVGEDVTSASHKGQRIHSHHVLVRACAHCSTFSFSCTCSGTLSLEQTNL